MCSIYEHSTGHKRRLRLVHQWGYRLSVIIIMANYLCVHFVKLFQAN